MVDALRESWRVLGASGTLVDLRPLHSSNCAIEVVTPEEVVQVGEVDASGAVVDDVAADRAIGHVVEDGWFVLHQNTSFEFEFSWDTVGEMTSFMEGSRRMRRVTPSYADLDKAHRDLSAEAAGRARLRYLRPMMLAVYQKATNQSLERARKTTARILAGLV